MQQIAGSLKDQDIFSQTVNLSDLFRPDTFLNALRQQTARATKQPMDTLVLSASWSGEVKHGKNISIKITGLQLEGCSFDGGRLSESAPDSPSVTGFPPCYIAWVPRVSVPETRATTAYAVRLGRGSARDARDDLAARVLQRRPREDGDPTERAVRQRQGQVAAKRCGAVLEECLNRETIYLSIKSKSGWQ